MSAPDVDDDKRQQQLRKLLCGAGLPGLATYVYIEDGAVQLGNLPMSCPDCGRLRVNFHPDRHRLDCEKCDWSSPRSLVDGSKDR